MEWFSVSVVAFSERLGPSGSLFSVDVVIPLDAVVGVAHVGSLVLGVMIVMMVMVTLSIVVPSPHAAASAVSSFFLLVAPVSVIVTASSVVSHIVGILAKVES